MTADSIQANFDQRAAGFIMALVALGQRSIERNPMDIGPTNYLQYHVSCTLMRVVVAGLKMQPVQTARGSSIIVRMATSLPAGPTSLLWTKSRSRSFSGSRAMTSTSTPSSSRMPFNWSSSRLRHLGGHTSGGSTRPRKASQRQSQGSRLRFGVGTRQKCFGGIPNP